MSTCRSRDWFHSVLTSCRLSTLTLNIDTADSHPENVDVEVAEYDSSTDEEEEVEGGGSHIPGLDRRWTFLLGTTTRYGRQIRINNRFLI